mgnify:FL=1
MHNRSYNEQDAIQRLLLFEEGLSRLIELMKIEKKDVLGNDMDFLSQSCRMYAANVLNIENVMEADKKKRLEKLLRYWSRLTSVLG